MVVNLKPEPSIPGGVIVEVTDNDRDLAMRYAHWRSGPKEARGVGGLIDVKSSPFLAHYHGMLVELAWSNATGLAPSAKWLRGGDGGVDFTHSGITIEAKYNNYESYRAYFYPVIGKEFIADIGVLGISPYHDDRRDRWIELIGWTTQSNWEKHKVMKTFRDDVGPQPALPAQKMYPIEQLLREIPLHCSKCSAPWKPAMWHLHASWRMVESESA